MKITEQLEEIVDRWNLLKHPFYRAWSEGTLTRDALKIYANEYGNFINCLPDGWKALKDNMTANEELEHAGLWSKFAAALGTHVFEPQLKETWNLVNITKSLFTNRTKALGALYAFEVQQPATSRSKVAGLIQHYEFAPESREYFHVHSENWGESEKLLHLMVELDEIDRLEAVQACERMCAALWQALTGIYNKTCQVN